MGEVREGSDEGARWERQSGYRERFSSGRMCLATHPARTKLLVPVSTTTIRHVTVQMRTRYDLQPTFIRFSESVRVREEEDHVALPIICIGVIAWAGIVRRITVEVTVPDTTNVPWLASDHLRMIELERHAFAKQEALKLEHLRVIQGLHEVVVKSAGEVLWYEPMPPKSLQPTWIIVCAVALPAWTT